MYESTSSFSRAFLRSCATASSTAALCWLRASMWSSQCLPLFQPFATGVHSRPKSAFMFVARDWLCILERMSRSRSASGRNMDFGRL